jgi:Secretion system C-terminal sorting domain
MKKRLLLIAMLVMAATMPALAQRYLSEIFSSTSTMANVVYGANITVITGQPALDSLRMDIYTPMGDTATDRPVIFIAHTGSFLPYPVNGGCTGSRSDYNIVQTCQKFAKRGFVAVAISYRQGWNPVGNQEVRTGTLLNAAYRGIQDIRTAARYMRLTAANGDPYGIDVDKFVAGGYGTGGYISLGAGYLDSYDEINLPKFLNSQGNSFVDTTLSGNPEGTVQRPLCIPNHVGQSSSFQFIWNAGGAIGDSSWMEAGEPAVSCLHVPNDPFAPYDYGAVIVPTTGDFVVNVSGSKGVTRNADRLGINATVNAGVYSDAVSMAASAASGGIDALFPYRRPGVEAGPWEFWDTATCAATNNANSLATNPDMSQAKADAYIDSTVMFLAPRIVCALGLPGCISLGSAEPSLANSVNVFPNPSVGTLNIRSQVAGASIINVELMDLNGRLVRSISGNKAMEVRMDNDDLAPGMYLVKVQTSKGIVTKKVIME